MSTIQRGGTITQTTGSRTSIQNAAQRENPQINQYSAAFQGAEGDFIPGLHNKTKNFGSYMPDSAAQESARDFYETLEAVGQIPTPRADNATEIIRTAPITEREIDLVRASKEANLKMKNDQYWTSQIDPALPWTLTEVAKVRPDILDKRINAITQLSQYTLDYEILRHLGHGGNPRLAELQYMIDQGQMEHMPKSTIVRQASTRFRHGQFSVWNAFTGGNDRNATGRFSDGRLNLARTGVDRRFDGLGDVPHMLPTSGPRTGRDMFTGPQNRPLYAGGGALAAAAAGELL